MANYTEVKESPRWHWHEGQFEAMRIIKCAWADQYAVMQELGNFPGSQYPYTQHGPADALVRDIKGRGFGQHSVGAGGLCTYPECLLTVHHSTLGPRYLGGVLIKENIRPMALHHRLDHKRLMWDSDSGGTHVESGEAPSFVEYGLEYTVTYFRQQSVPASALARAGKVNANEASATTLGLTFPAQTLLYMGADIVDTVSTGGMIRYDITWHYAFKAGEWNKYWRRKNATFEKMYYVGQGQYLQHGVTDFTA